MPGVPTTQAQGPGESLAPSVSAAPNAFQMGRGSFLGLQAAGGQIRLLAEPAPLGFLPTSPLALRTCGGTKAGTPDGHSTPGLSLSGQQEPRGAARVLAGWEPTMPAPTACPCFGERTHTDAAWGCQGGTAGHGVLRAPVSIAVHVLCRGRGRGCSQVVTVFGGCRQQRVTVCVIPAGAGDG